MSKEYEETIGGSPVSGRTERPVLGILAHVDAGKTTLSESLLFQSGAIRKMGRVDTRDAFLDTDSTERARGITIYSKTALFPSPDPAKNRIYTLLDTPGHTDFSAETERTLAVLDFAVLLISAPEGVNVQVKRLFELLTRYRVPHLIFVNKMDQMTGAAPDGTRTPEEDRVLRSEILSRIQKELTPAAVDFTDGAGDPTVQENIALASGSEELLDRLLAGGEISGSAVRELFAARKICPVLYGSALKNQGVAELLALLDSAASAPAARASSGTAFAARVFKITRDRAGERETWMKITGGMLKVRQSISYEERTEKVSQIRLYNGEKYTAVPQGETGMICAVTGLSETFAGQGLGEETGRMEQLLQPVLAWQIVPFNSGPEDLPKLYRQLKLLEEEEPMLQVEYDERKKEIRAHLMGEVQREVLSGRIHDRFGVEVTFQHPSVVYRETIAAPVAGVGHFEPLRHYAEVHLLLTPGDPGSGIVIDSACPSDALPRQYQNQVLTNLACRAHRGVLTGALLTDVRMTLIAGKAHEKHTEGGDFRQAAFRAVRQGLMMAENVLLEPFYDFSLTVPQENLGRALLDLQNMGASFSQPDLAGDTAQITGKAPVAEMGFYTETLSAYTKGQGELVLRTGDWLPCRNAEEVIRESGYDPELDRGQPSSSVFCSHGAGTVIPWYEVRNYMHVEDGYGTDRGPAAPSAAPGRFSPEKGRAAEAPEEELMAIFERTFGPVKRRLPAEEEARRIAAAERRKEREERQERELERAARRAAKSRAGQKEYLLVDGYNIIYAWESLRELAAADLKAARDQLLDILSNYAGYADRSVICVFDAYRVPGGKERTLRYHNIDVVFTREAETADQYIEIAAHELTKSYRVAVATSDAVEQMIIYGTGALRLSAMDFQQEIARADEAMRETLRAQNGRRNLQDFPDPRNLL